MSHAELPPLTWTPAPTPRRRVWDVIATRASVVVLVVAHVAFLIDLHNAVTTPASCDVYCATVPAVEIPALIGWPVLDFLCFVCSGALFDLRGPRQVLAWVLLSALPMQVAVGVQMITAVRLLS